MSGRSGAIRSTWQTFLGFTYAGYRDALSYPLNFAFEQVNIFVPIVSFYFISHLVRGPSVGTSYFTFVLVGLLVFRLLSAGLDDFSAAFQRLVAHGQFELMISEPIQVSAIPFVLFGWVAATRMVSALAILGLGLVLNAQLQVAGALPAIGVLLLGLLAAHAIGVVSVSIRVLSKRNDPVSVLFALGAQTLAGTMFPLGLLPQPLRTLSYFIPHTYVTDALRQLLIPGFESAVGLSPLACALMLGAFILVTYAIGIALFNRTIAYGRRAGILGSY